MANSVVSTHKLIDKYLEELATTGDLTPAGVSYYDLLGVRIEPLTFKRNDGFEDHHLYNLSLSPDVFIELIREPLTEWVEKKLSEPDEKRNYEELCNFFIKDVFPKRSKIIPRLFDLRTIPEVGTLLSDLIVDYVKEQFEDLHLEDVNSVRRLMRGMPLERFDVPQTVKDFLENEYKVWLRTSYSELCDDTEFSSKFDKVYTQYDVATSLREGYVGKWGYRDPDSYPPVVERYRKIRVDIHPLNFADYYMTEDIVSDAITYCPEIREMVLTGTEPCDELAEKFKAYCTTWVKGFMLNPRNISDYAYTMINEAEGDLGITEDTMLDDCIVDEDDEIVGAIEDMFVKNRDGKEVSWDELGNELPINVSR